MMKRAFYFNYIHEKLNELTSSIEMRGKLNILDFHLHSESFYLHFLNTLFDWQLENVNAVKHNTEAIDLIDKTNKIVIQVSATATKQKIESALSKDLSAHKGYTFMFVSISKDAAKLRKISYKNPDNLSFNPQSDIYDIPGFLKIVFDLDIEKQKIIYDFVQKELGKEPAPARMDSNITHIINLLSKEDFDSEAGNYQVDSFEIERKIDYNNLNSMKSSFNEYAAYSNRVDKIYKEFNKSGVNKSSSVLAFIRSTYLRNKSIKSDDALFHYVVDHVIEKVKKSTNYTPIPDEELAMCVEILIVDAFIRCKIFENPDRYTYAAAR